MNYELTIEYTRSTTLWSRKTSRLFVDFGPQIVYTGIWPFDFSEIMHWSVVMSERRGFTLIELLVVIAIIALLMAVLMPALQRVRRQAKTVACLSRVKQWSLYFAMYAEDHDGRFMAGHTAQPQANRWISALGDYYKWDDEFTCCPNATKPWVDEYGVDSGATGTDVGVTMAWGYMPGGSHWKKQMKGSY